MLQQSPLTEEERQSRARWTLVYVFGIPPLDAFAVWLLWAFFMVPLGIREISYWHALGLSVFVSYMLQTAFAGVYETPDPRKATTAHVALAIGTLILAILARLLMQ